MCNLSESQSMAGSSERPRCDLERRLRFKRALERELSQAPPGHERAPEPAPARSSLRGLTRGTWRTRLDGVPPQPGQPRAACTPGLGSWPPAPAFRCPHISELPGAAVLTSPADSRGPSDAMARGSEAARPGRPAAAPSGGQQPPVGWPG